MLKQIIGKTTALIDSWGAPRDSYFIPLHSIGKNDEWFAARMEGWN
jgi:hypothetical protein